MQSATLESVSKPTFFVAPYHRNVPEKRLLADVRRVGRKLKTGSLAAATYDDHGRFSSITIAKRFGSWTAALARWGLLRLIFSMSPARTGLKIYDGWRGR